MKVNFAAETETLIAQRALEAGISPEVLVVQTVTAWLGQKSGVSGKALPGRHLAGGIITPQ